MHKLLSVFIVVVTFVSCGNHESGGEENQSSEDKVVLKFCPEKGTEKRVLLKIISKTSSIISMSTTSEIESRMLIKDVATNGDVTLEMEYEKFSMEVDAMGTKVSFDSDKDLDQIGRPEFQSFAMMGSLLNKPFVSVVDSRGKIIKSPDIAALIPDSVKVAAGREQPLQSNQMFDNLLMGFPEGEITIGEKWSNENTIETENGPIHVKTDNSVEKVTSDEIQITVSGDISGDVKDKNGVKIQMKGTLSGTTVLDRKTGITRQSDIVENLNMSMMGINMSMELTFNISIK